MSQNMIGIHKVDYLRGDIFILCTVLEVAQYELVLKDLA
jgi:hypothetical protein